MQEQRTTFRYYRLLFDTYRQFDHLQLSSLKGADPLECFSPHLHGLDIRQNWGTYSYCRVYMPMTTKFAVFLAFDFSYSAKTFKPLLLGFGESASDKLETPFAISVLLFGFLVTGLAAFMPMRVLDRILDIPKIIEPFD